MLSIYFNLNLIFVILIVISSILVYYIYYLDKTKRPLPAILRRFLIYSKVIYKYCFSNFFFQYIKLELRDDYLLLNQKINQVLKLLCINIFFFIFFYLNIIKIKCSYLLEIMHFGLLKKIFTVNWVMNFINSFTNSNA